MSDDLEAPARRSAEPAGEGVVDTSVVRPDPQGLRALAHPLRLRLLGLLRADGPATASQLAVRTGQSSGSTSYHLRQLAAAGFVTEEEGRGNARDRWWRAVHRMTSYDVTPDDEESRAVGEQYLRVVAAANFRRLDETIAASATIESELGPGWDRAFDVSDYALRLTRDEAVALTDELAALAARYRFDDPERRSHAPEGARQVMLQFQVLPVVPLDEAGGEGHAHA